MNLRISPSSLDTWMKCREKWRIQYVENVEAVHPAIHRHFGSAVHLMCKNYWNGETYDKAFGEAFTLAMTMDTSKLNSTEQSKWSGMLDTLAPITSAYYEFHGNAWRVPPMYNENKMEWPLEGGLTVVGIIDRYQNGTLTDTKTCSAVGRSWRVEKKKELLREPQLPFYRRFFVPEATVLQYEMIIKTYKGSDPEIELWDMTDEFNAVEQRFNQQVDWYLKEIKSYVDTCRDARPWPMSNGICRTVYGDCDFLPVCLGRATLTDEKLYKIKEAR